MIATIPSTSGKLQASVQANLNRWMAPCYTAPYEHITATANDQGEVVLFGLVNDHGIVDEAIQMVKALYDIHFVSDHVTVMYKGSPVKL